MGAAVQRCMAAAVQRCRGAEVQRCRGAEVQRCRGAKVQRCRGEGAGAYFYLVSQEKADGLQTLFAPENIQGDQQGWSSRDELGQ